MKIGLVNLEPKYTNLALEKVKMYYGEESEYITPIQANAYDKVYCSSIFNFTKKDYVQANWICGGTGFDIKSKLPDEIDKLKPKINIGFATRGCIRKCPWCVVPEKEGNIKVEADIYDIWDGKNKEIKLLDNNILALPKHFELICNQIQKEKLKIDFNQGLDHRLLTPELCNMLLSLKHIHEIRFAFDNIKYEKTVINALKMLRSAGLKDWGSRWYVYVGVKDNCDSVYKRLTILRNEKQAVYVMRDIKVYKNPVFMALASWGNTIGAFKVPLDSILEKSKRLQPYAKYFKYLRRRRGNEQKNLMEL